MCSARSLKLSHLRVNRQKPRRREGPYDILRNWWPPRRRIARVQTFGVFASFEFGSIRLYTSLDDALNIKKILSDGEAEFSLVCTKTYKVGGTIGSTRKFQILALIHLHTASRPNLISKAIVPPSSQSGIQHWNFSRSPPANKKPFELKEVIVSFVRIGDLDSLLSFAVKNKFADDKLVGTSFKNLYVCKICSSARGVTLRNSGFLYISPLKRKKRQTN